MSELKQRCKALADSLYEFSGQDFSDRNVKRHFQMKLHNVLVAMRQMGVYIVQPELSVRDQFGREIKAIFSGVSFDMSDEMPTYKFEQAILNGEKL